MLQIEDTYALTVRCEFQIVRITSRYAFSMSNFVKRNLRSGHLMRPDHVTFGVIGSSFFENVSNCWLNSYGNFGGTTRRRFFRYLQKKTLRGVTSAPTGARVNM